MPDLRLLLVLAEIALLCAAAFALLRRTALGLAEAASTAIVLTLALLSCLAQAVLLAGVPGLLPLLEAVLALAALGIVVRERARLGRAAGQVLGFAREHRATSGLFPLASAYLFLQTLLLPPGNSDSMSYNLARVLLFRQEGTVFLDRYTDPHQAFQPMGFDVLAHLFLRLRTDHGVAVVSFLAYLAVVLGAFGLARRYAARRPAWTAALVVASLPEIVFQATSTKPDLATAAAAVCSLAAVHRLLARPSARDLAILGLALAFGLSCRTTFAAFALPLLVLGAILLVRRHGLAAWGAVIGRHRVPLALALAPIGLLSPLWLFARNRWVAGVWFGPAEWVAQHRNGDGAVGAVANLSRYLLESVDFLRPVEPLVARVTGRTLAEWLMAADRRWLEPLWDGAGASRWSFSIARLPHEDVAWFGPLGLLVVLPALLYSGLRGPRALRALVLLLAGYVVLISWQVAWMPWNSRFFTLFFACASPAVAFLVGRSRRTWPGHLLRGLALLILFYACVFNRQKPLIRHFWDSWPRQAATHSVWVGSGFGTDRLYYAKRYFGDDRVSEIGRLLPADAAVGLVATRTWVYPFLRERPDVRFVQLRPEVLESEPRVLSEEGIAFLLCLETDCGWEPPGGGAALWQSEPAAGRRRGVLYPVIR